MSDASYARFVTILQRHAPSDLPAEGTLSDTPLRELGFDSMSSVDLLMDLEETFGIVFQDEQLSAETFSTTRSLWDAVAPLLHADA